MNTGQIIGLIVTIILGIFCTVYYVIGSMIDGKNKYTKTTTGLGIAAIILWIAVVYQAV